MTKVSPRLLLVLYDIEAGRRVNRDLAQVAMLLDLACVVQNTICLTERGREVVKAMRRNAF